LLAREGKVIMFQDIRRHEFSAVQRSYLWPTLLIGLGLVWLLRELELFSNANLAILLRLWPLILIVIGVEVFLRDESRRIRQIVALGGLALVAVLVAVAPALGLWQVNAKSFDKMVALDNTTSATVNLNLGELNYAVSGDQEKTITLDNPADGLNFLDWFGADLHTNVGLTSAVPIKLTLVNGSGRSTLDLATLKLTTLTVNSGSGVVSATLPSWTQPYVATITGGSGMQNITIPANTSVDLRLTGVRGVRESQLAAMLHWT
jgi:hypothetical protein